ncbi:hypothetical protein L210DRAFT_181231 [Boletus edulis BED1]|uniref:Uncharacterized protein n=1 Tax=Boletus edulis BED1 TaxID=1328754 RepID=A0AAD4GGI4_BOLED|nr:hypothetical protein L210DRAFT_181231 [Boletus edulis BED1]
MAGESQSVRTKKNGTIMSTYVIISSHFVGGRATRRWWREDPALLVLACFSAPALQVGLPSQAEERSALLPIHSLSRPSVPSRPPPLIGLAYRAMSKEMRTQRLYCSLILVECEMTRYHFDRAQYHSVTLACVNTDTEHMKRKLRPVNPGNSRARTVISSLGPRLDFRFHQSETVNSHVLRALELRGDSTNQ